MKYRLTLETIFKLAISAIGRHLWYLSEELSPFGLFSEHVSNDTKEIMVQKLHSIHDKNNHKRSIKASLPSEDFINCGKLGLEWFIGPALRFMFTTLRIDTLFMESPNSQWMELPSYQSAKSIISVIKVVNDSSERAIALAKTFISTISKQEQK